MAQDPDETSESDPTEVDVIVGPSLRKPFPKQTVDDCTSVKTSRVPLTILPDPHFQLTPLIEQASLLTSLLRIYPRSTDQKGLRDDIALLASVQNQHLAGWLDFEVGQARKMAGPHTPRVGRSMAWREPVPRPPANVDVAEAEKMQRDDEVRGLLSADAEVWRDGSGVSVADVSSDSASTGQGCSDGVKVESSPAARTSGRERVTPARFKTE